MRDSARIQTAIRLIEELELSLQKHMRGLPLDMILHHHFKANRYIGSKDRAAISQMVYFTVRHLGSLRWHAHRYGLSVPRASIIGSLIFDKRWAPETIREVFDGSEHNPAPLSLSEREFCNALAQSALYADDIPEDIRFEAPTWLFPELKASLENWQEELLALQQEAPVDLRTNTLLTTREELLGALQKEGFPAIPCPLSPVGVRLTQRTPVFTSQAFRNGWFEMQDEGSQLVSLMACAKPGEKVIDFCAGAGGKTLAIAAQMQGKGRILAWDISGKRLEQIKPRLKRAKVDNVQTHLLENEQDQFIKRHKDSADLVVIDAPCSGSGTWRRNPDLKWRLSALDLKEIIDTQQNILQSASRLVKKQGRLLYITCSLLKSENESQIAIFLHQKKNFRVVTPGEIWDKSCQPTMAGVSTVRLTPHKDGTDGFYATLMQRFE